jgi:hypothetical protein
MVTWKWRIPVSVIAGMALGMFGVFLFSNFTYRGINLEENVLHVIASPGGWFIGWYQLLSSGLSVNFFGVFSAGNLQVLGLWGIISGPYVWPVVATWLSAGFVAGVVIKGVKRGLYAAFGTYVAVGLLWFVTGMLAGADLAQMWGPSLLSTLNILLTGLIFVLVGGVVGGFFSGPPAE